MAKPTKESVYEEVRKAGKKGTALSSKFKIPYLEELLREEKIKKVGKKYYLPEIEVLYGRNQVIDYFLSNGYLRRSGKKYVIKTPEKAKIPSFLEFIEALQNIYLRNVGEYRRSINILSLVEELSSEINLPRALTEKWIFELPKIFIGIVDFRLFPDEPRLELDNGVEVSRIYLDREIVGL